MALVLSHQGVRCSPSRRNRWGPVGSQSFVAGAISLTFKYKRRRDRIDSVSFSYGFDQGLNLNFHRTIYY